MDAEQKLSVIESILVEHASQEILQMIRNHTNDDTFGLHADPISVAASGYELNIDTSEGDADHYSTQVIKVGTRSDVHFYYELASKFHADDESGWGNESMDDHDIGDILGDLLEFNPDISQETRSTWESIDADHNLLCEMVLGYPVDYESEPNFCRVFESFTVYSIVNGVRTDVTDTFNL